MLAIRRARAGVLGFLWSAFGLAAIMILAGELGSWNIPLGAVQAGLIAGILPYLGVNLQVVAPGILMVADPTGWSVLKVGVECSSLIELSILTGMLMFYPRFNSRQRLLRLGAGWGAILLVNLLRISSILVVVAIFGKPAVPWAHTLVGRLIFFAGVVMIYWRLLTIPTLHMVRRDLEVSGRAVM
jgi:exosortase family protein XrtG